MMSGWNGMQLNGNGYRAAIGAANRLNTGISVPNAWLVETLLTFILVIVVFAATDSVRSAQSLHIPVRLLPCALKTFGLYRLPFSFGK